MVCIQKFERFEYEHEKIVAQGLLGLKYGNLEQESGIWNQVKNPEYGKIDFSKKQIRYEGQMLWSEFKGLRKGTDKNSREQHERILIIQNHLICK